MNAPTKQPGIVPVSVESFRARAIEAASKVRAGALDLHDGVDALQAYAVARGLVAGLGQDGVQSIMAEAFSAPMVSGDDVAPIPDDQYEGLSSTFAAACRKADQEQARKPKAPPPTRDIVAQSTVDATAYVIKQNDPEQLRKWLARYSPRERAAILARLDSR